MPRRLPLARAAIVAGLLIATPGGTFAQRHGGGWHGGGWHGGGWHGGGWHGGGWHGGYGYRYGGYGGRYYGYGGHYRGYYGYPAYYGAVIWPPLFPYFYAPVAYLPPPPPPMLPPQMAPAPQVTHQQCTDGSTVPVGSYCPSPPPAAPPLLPAPLPTPERG